LATKMGAYNSNLAGEFYVLSMMHRLGADATLTLGNKKSVDIVIIRAAGDAVTLDVKALAGKTCWPVDNFRGAKERHFLALVCFLGKIDDLATVPEIYIVPSADIGGLTYTAPGGRKTIELRIIRRTGEKYRSVEAWKQLL
jgi:hypothetical protein